MQLQNSDPINKILKYLTVKVRVTKISFFFEENTDYQIRSSTSTTNLLFLNLPVIDKGLPVPRAFK